MAALLIAFQRYLLATPTALISLILGGYCLLGAANLSVYRGLIEPETRLYFLWCLVAVVAGTLSIKSVVVRPPLPVADRWGKYSVKLIVICCLSAVPGLIGIAWAASSSAGVPLLNPELRHEVPPAAVILAELLLVPWAVAVTALVSVRHISLQSIRHVTLLSSMFVLLVLIVLMGFRGWIVVAGSVFLLAAYVGNSGTKAQPAPIGRLLFWTALLLATVSAIGYLRRLQSETLVAAEVVVAYYEADSLGAALGLLHFALREQIAISQKFFTENLLPNQHLLFAELVTLLPGEQPSPGRLLADELGGIAGGGLTPGLPGVLFHDLGFVGMLGSFFLFGVLVAAFFRSYCSGKKLYQYVLYVLVLASFFHLFHRGFFKAQYIVVPLGFWLTAAVLPRLVILRKRPIAPLMR